MWLRESKKGEKYMAGTLGGVKVLLFKNKKKRNESDPDYILCFDHAKRGESVPDVPPEE
jgi:hypothetical protein